MTRWRLGLLVSAVTTAQLIVGLALIVILPEPNCPTFRYYSYMYGRCVGNLEFDRGGGDILAGAAGRLMLLYLLVVLILLLAVVVALLVAEWRRAAVGSGRMRRHLFALVLVVLALSVGTVATSLLDPLMHADVRRPAITTG
jgi:hypothetical protein